MAIAPFEETGGTTRRAKGPALRVVPGGRQAGAPPRRTAVHAVPVTREVPSRSRDAHPSAQRAISRPRAERHLGLGDMVDPRGLSARGRPVAVSAATRRRRAAGAAVTLVAIVLLALPIRALGAVTVAGQDTPGGVPAGLAPGSTIVVQPGETIRSVAVDVNANDAAKIARALAAEVGSSTLVPGEHVVIP